MPSISYQEVLLERLTDPEYALLYLQTSLEEALADGFMDAFPLALENVLEAASRTSQDFPSTVDIARQNLLDLLSEHSPLTREVVIDALETAGFDLEMNLREAQLSRLE